MQETVELIVINALPIASIRERARLHLNHVRRGLLRAAASDCAPGNRCEKPHTEKRTNLRICEHGGDCTPNSSGQKRWKERTVAFSKPEALQFCRSHAHEARLSSQVESTGHPWRPTAQENKNLHSGAQNVAPHLVAPSGGLVLLLGPSHAALHNTHALIVRPKSAEHEGILLPLRIRCDGRATITL